MLVIGIILVVIFIVYLLVVILDKIDQRANELQLSLDGIKARLYYQEQRK